MGQTTLQKSSNSKTSVFLVRKFLDLLLKCFSLQNEVLNEEQLISIFHGDNLMNQKV